MFEYQSYCGGVTASTYSGVKGGYSDGDKMRGDADIILTGDDGM